MNILIVTQYFWPETFRINDFALGLQERGHAITIFTAKPNYPRGKFYEGYSFFKKRKEIWNGITVYRSNLIPRGNGSGLRLMLNYLSFAFCASLKAFFHSRKYDLIFVYEPSPITIGIPAIIFSKKNKAPIYFWVQDLWPESVSAAGQIKNKFVLKLLDKLTKWIYDNSEKILIQSEGFREYILNQGIENEKIIYYPNSTESLYKVIIPNEKIRKKIPLVPFSIMFAGNIGESQDFETILDAAKILKAKSLDIHFIILGDGRKKNFVIEKVDDYNLKNNFHLLGAFPVEEMPHFFACSDALLVTLKKNKIFSLTIPSKVQSYLACAKPIIAGLEGEGAKIINNSRAGFTSNPGDASKLAENIFKLYKMSNEERILMGNNAKGFFEENFEREKLIDRFLEIIK
ncbi:glycosyltransferase family 4 protein [Polaribacter sp.]|uniref:glycosyltransferase family 4 protein n=1 Tax=Polaribacter sp. TaxID=1920175 RepID=UPI004048CA14